MYISPDRAQRWETIQWLFFQVSAIGPMFGQLGYFNKFAGKDIADIALIGWVRNLITFYEARELVGFDSLPHIATWLERSLARPAVQRGLEIPSR